MPGDSGFWGIVDFFFSPKEPKKTNLKKIPCDPAFLVRALQLLRAGPGRGEGQGRAAGASAGAVGAQRCRGILI